MPVTSTNLIQGPATIYGAPFGTAEPATIATAPAAGWVDLGGTKDGVSLAIESDWSVLSVDQLVDEVGRVRTKRAVSVKTSLAEATLANLARAIGSAALPAAQVLEPEADAAAFAATYFAYLIDGVAPGGFRRRIILRKALATDSVELAYKKDDQTVIPATFTAHYVSASIKPWKIEDALT